MLGFAELDAATVEVVPGCEVAEALVDCVPLGLAELAGLVALAIVCVVLAFAELAGLAVGVLEPGTVLVGCVEVVGLLVGTVSETCNALSAPNTVLLADSSGTLLLYTEVTLLLKLD